jgi:phosphoribosylformimino-5-aminoimidazole carboxamide ribotide isomerase
MIVIPAVDLREGACVQLVGGRYDDERVRIADPLAAARGWARAGFTRLHVVDLDAATGRGANAEVIDAILGEPGIETQVGGGVRDRDAIARLLARGARRVVVGTRTIEDPAWLAAMARDFPDRLIVAADARGGRVVTHGWSRATASDVLDVVAAIDGLPLAAVLVTAVDREGRMEGADLDLVRAVRGSTRRPLHVAGGIASARDLDALATIGADAAILGMALYSGALDPEWIAREYAS